MRQNWNNTRASNESSFETRKPSLEFWETSIFYTHHLKGFQETMYFSRNINHSHIHWMYGPTELACSIWAKLSLSFYVIKKDQQKVFIWKFGNLTHYFCIKSIFWTIKTVFIFVKVCIYGHHMQQPKLKRDWNMILNSRCDLVLVFLTKRTVKNKEDVDNTE